MCRCEGESFCRGRSVAETALEVRGVDRALVMEEDVATSDNLEPVWAAAGVFFATAERSATGLCGDAGSEQTAIGALLGESPRGRGCLTGRGEPEGNEGEAERVGREPEGMGERVGGWSAKTLACVVAES
jgi:hypothetical protein